MLITTKYVTLITEKGNYIEIPVFKYLEKVERSVTQQQLFISWRQFFKLLLFSRFKISKKESVVFIMNTFL